MQKLYLPFRVEWSIKISTMRSRILLAIILTLCSIIPLSAQQIKREVKGNGYTLLQHRSVSPFTDISIRDNLALYISQGNTMPLTIDADDNLFDYIITEVNGSTLNVQIVDTVELKHGKGTGVFLSTPRIEGITASNGAKVVGSKVLQGDSLNLVASNSSTIEASLNYKKLYVECNQTSQIKLHGHVDSLFIKSGSEPFVKLDKLEVDFRGSY